MGSGNSSLNPSLNTEPVLFECQEKFCTNYKLTAKIYNITRCEYEKTFIIDDTIRRIVPLKNDGFLIRTSNYIQLYDHNYEPSTNHISCTDSGYHTILINDRKKMIIISLDQIFFDNSYKLTNTLCTVIEIDKTTETCNTTQIPLPIKYSQINIPWHFILNDVYVICVRMLYISYTMSSTDGKIWTRGTHDHLIQPLMQKISLKSYGKHGLIMVETDFTFKLVQADGKSIPLFNKNSYSNGVYFEYDKYNNTIVMITPQTGITTKFVHIVIYNLEDNRLGSIFRDFVVDDVNLHENLIAVCTRKHILLKDYDDRYIIDKETLKLKTKMESTPAVYFHPTTIWIQNAIKQLKEIDAINKLSEDLLRLITEFVS